MISTRHLDWLFAFGRLFSPLYGRLMRLRSWLYAKGLLASTRLPVPVVSVGNLTLGGTGKTPMVIHLARLLSASRRPGVVSRGYGGRSRQPVNLVSDGAHLLLPAAEAGDEPVLIAQSLPGVPVVTAKKRVAGGLFLVEQGLADTILLDDGFQHLALQRDINIVLLAVQARVHTMRVFPGGWLREPHAALQRADCFVLTGCQDGHDQAASELRNWLNSSYASTPVFNAIYMPVGLYSQAGAKADFDDLHGVALFAFCGLANPQSFRQTMDRHLSIHGWQAFADHHPFSAADLDELARQATACGCVGLITTEKDFVKLREFPCSMPLWVLKVELVIEEGFDNFIHQRLTQIR